MQTGAALFLLHTLPHAPQLLVSLWVFVVQPIPRQSAIGGTHTGAPHAPFVQTSPAGQPTPHAPQLLELVEVCVSHPSLAFALQSAVPAGQLVTTHDPLHATVSPPTTLQTLPQ
jgi:hypothetical protein